MPPVICRYCPREIPASRIDAARGIGRCDACQTIVDVRAQLRPPQARPDAGRNLPGGIEVETGPGSMTLTVHHGARDRFPWGGLIAAFLVGGAVWYAAGGRWSRVAMWFRTEILLDLTLDHPELLVEAAGLLLGPLLAVLVFVLRRPSRTVVTATGTGMTVRRSLLPWIGTVRYDTLDIDQLYSKEQTFQMTGIDPEDGEFTDVDGWTYELRARMRDRSDRLVVDGLWKAEQALFLEQRLEEFLDLPDRPVPTEIERCPDRG